MGMTIYVLAVAMLLVGLYAVVAKKNVIKLIIGVLIIDYAVNMLLVLVGYRAGKSPQAPILAKGQSVQDFAARSVDPLPQAMVLTSIVIGLATTALLLSFAVFVHRHYGTLDVRKIKELRG